MTSEKFGELADVIAEKAARKIRTVEFSNITTLRHSYQSDRPINKKSYKEQQTHTRVDSKVNKGTKEDDDNSGKFGKINTKAFLKHDVSSQELYLNYKHITKELKKNRETKMNPNKDRKYPDSGSDDTKFSDHSREQFQHTSKGKPLNVESKEHKNIKMKSRLDESIDKKHSVSDVSSDDEDEDSISNKTTSSKKTTQNIKSSQEYSEEDKALGRNKKDSSNFDKKYNKILILQTTKTKTDDTSSDASNIENKMDTRTDTKESQEHKSPNYSSKEVVEVGINRAFTDDSSEHSVDRNLDSPAKEDKHQAKTPTEKKQIVRRENGKLYTFISSPDYDEYHENVGKLKTRHNYINTYK